MSVELARMVPAVQIIGQLSDGVPYLKGSRCGKCEQIYVGVREACARCGFRGMVTATLQNRGTLFNYTIVYRSFPGVKTPFVDSVVDLDCGATIRGTLIEIDAKSAELQPGLRVEVVFRPTGQIDTTGKTFLCYYFVPLHRARGEADG
jgi:uncharacterized OB-fold protein